jgi:U3 small nucleolar RNA-associated protein 20
LNAWSSNRIDEIDYDRRFAGYQKINEEMMDTLSETQAYCIVFNYIYFMAHNDLSIRGNASYGLGKIVEQVAKGSRKLRPQIVTETILPAVRRGLDTVATIARQEFTNLLNNIIKVRV